MATSGLVPEIVGSSFSFFVKGDVLPAFSGEGVNRCPRLGEGTAEEGGVSFKVSLFLGDVLTPSLVPGKSSLLLAPPPPCDKAASLARCICCLRGVWLMSGEYVSGIERRPLAWITASSGLCSWWSLNSKLPDSRRRSGIRGVRFVGVLSMSGLWFRLLKMLRMFMWLTLV